VSTARNVAKAYDWPDIIARYAALYQDVAYQKANERHRVSVVLRITTMRDYINEAVEASMIAM
jgi:hypothetical protein